MTSSGYSSTPLAQKLGIKQGHQVHFRDAPDSFLETPGDLPDSVTRRTTARAERSLDVILFFVKRSGALSQSFGSPASKIRWNGGLWIAWPKKSSGVETDLTDYVVRSMGLDHGLVDNKVCAIDETWSALRFVHRLENRPAD